jgi:hypothetical protein
MQQKPKGPGLPRSLEAAAVQLGAAGAALLGAGRASAASSASADAGTAQAGSLDELGLDELQARMASGEETSASITRSTWTGSPSAMAASARCWRPTRTRWPRQKRWTGSERREAARPLHGIPCCSRTTSPPRTGCTPPPARWR